MDIKRLPRENGGAISALRPTDTYSYSYKVQVVDFVSVLRKQNAKECSNVGRLYSMMLIKNT